MIPEMEPFKNQVFREDAIGLMRRMPPGGVDLLLTDIPYDAVNRQGGIRNMDKGKADVLTFDLMDFLAEAKRVTRGTIYIFCSTEQAGIIRGLWDKDPEWTHVRHCTWLKTNPLPAHADNFWINATEQCMAAKKPRAYFNGHYLRNVWEKPCGSSKRHPTEKPLSLFEDLVLASTQPGDIVFDPCAGSGTTAAAAAKHMRNYVCGELDKDFSKMIAERAAKAVAESRLLFWALEGDIAAVQEKKEADIANSMDGSRTIVQAGLPLDF